MGQNSHWSSEQCIVQIAMTYATQCLFLLVDIKARCSAFRKLTPQRRNALLSRLIDHSTEKLNLKSLNNRAERHSRHRSFLG